MKLLFSILLSLCITASLFCGIPQEKDISTFFDEVNKPFALSINGCNFNSSFYVGGIPHFNIEAGVTGLGFNIKKPDGKGDIKCAISMFSVEGNMGIFKGFSPAPLWSGFLGFEAGVRGSITPLFGALNEYKQKYPYGFSGLAKLNLLKNIGFIPAVSFSTEYSYLMAPKFRFSDIQTGEESFCSFSQSSFYYHFDIRENIGLVYIYTGTGWISSTIEGNYDTEENERDINSESETSNKFWFGLTIPVELIDVNLEFGKAGPYGFYGAALGFRM